MYKTNGSLKRRLNDLLAHPSCYLLAVDQPDQALAAANVVSDSTVRQPVDHGAVVHHVSAEEQLVLPVVEADAAAGMTRHVEHRQLPVAQVDDVT